MIKLKNVSLTYENHSEQTSVLNDVSVQVKEGEWVSLIGSSGSGKTSLLKMIGGMLTPTDGTLSIEEQQIYQLKEAAKHDFMRTHMSFVYQNFRLLPQFTVLENVMLPLIPYENKKKVEDKAKEIIHKVGLTHRRTHFPQQLSGGEQQRVAFARALLIKPALLLCDEPTGNLDATNRDRLLQLMEEIHADGQTIVLVTHDEVVANYGERIFLLEDGTLKERMRSRD